MKSWIFLGSSQVWTIFDVIYIHFSFSFIKVKVQNRNIFGGLLNSKYIFGNALYS